MYKSNRSFMLDTKMMALGVVLSGMLLNVMPAFAHAVVKPSQAGIGSFTDFSLGVPSEREVATTSVKLMLPGGLNNVSPIVKPGWKVEVKTSTANSQADDDGNLKPIPVEIDWTGGQIPVGQKDFFMFSAQVPSQPTELDWKVEQTYGDGSMVSWNVADAQSQPKDKDGKPDFSKSGPYSKTMVVNDLKSSPNPIQGSETGGRSDGLEKSTFHLSLIALALAALSLVWQFRTRKKNV